MDVVKCQANEVCTPTQPETQIYGLILGRCKVLTEPPKLATEQTLTKPVQKDCFHSDECFTTGSPHLFCMDRKCVEVYCSIQRDCLRTSPHAFCKIENGIGKCVENLWSLNEEENELFQIPKYGYGHDVKCKTERVRNIRTNFPVQRGNQCSFSISMLNVPKGKDALISIGLCGKNSSVNALTGMVPSSIGYHNDGGIYVESQMPTYLTHENFTTRDIITVKIDASHTVVGFYKYDDSPEDFFNGSAKGLRMGELVQEFKLKPHLINEEFYPCVGFSNAKWGYIRMMSFTVSSPVNPY